MTDKQNKHLDWKELSKLQKQSLIIGYLEEHNEADRKQISKGLNMNISTAYYNLEKLNEKGILKRSMVDNKGLGRPKAIYSLTNSYQNNKTFKRIKKYEKKWK